MIGKKKPLQDRGGEVERLDRQRHILDKSLDKAYAEMARDEGREREALEWAEGTVGDARR